MAREYAVFLRAISNVPMAPFRASLVALGLTEVASFGGTGNLVFCSPADSDVSSLERRIARVLETDAFVRPKSELRGIVVDNPFRGREGASVFLASAPLEDAQRERLGDTEFDGERPVAIGSSVYFVHPTRVEGRQGIADFERILGARGTMRGARVVERVLGLM